MITDKNGKEVKLNDILDFLVGTDDDDMAKSVIDFGLYPINEDKTIGAPYKYLVAVEAIVTYVSFMGPFTMMELDFRNADVLLINQVMKIVEQFHSDINGENLLMLSSITSLDRNASHILSLMNPLVCVRGYSESGKGSTLLQMIYATENVGFSPFEIDFAKVEADIEREMNELVAAQVTAESMEAANEEIDDSNNEMMKEMFTPDFGLRTEDEKRQDAMDGVRASYGSERESAKIEARKNARIGNAEKSKLKDVKTTDKDKDDIPENRV